MLWLQHTFSEKCK